MEIFKLFGSIFINNEEANSSIAKTDEKAGSLGKTMVEGLGTAAKWGAGIATAATAVVGGVMAATNETAKYADEIDKLSERTGINREELQRWRYAAGQSGADVGKLEVGVKKLSDVMDNAVKGNEGAADSFKKVGVSLDDLKDLSQEEIFSKVMDGLADMEQGAERNALGNDLLGKSYTEMLPLLNAGAQGMSDLKNRADELGIVMEESAIIANVVFGDTMADVQSSFAGVTRELTNTFLPVLMIVLNLILDNMPMIQGMFAQLAPVLGGLLQTILPILLDLAEKLLPIIFDLLESLLPLFATIVETVLPPLLQIIELLAPYLVEIIQKLLPPLIDIINILLPILMPVIEQILPILLELLKLIIDPLLELLELILPPLTTVIKFLAEALADNLSNAFTSVGKIIESTKQAFGGLIDFITGVFTGNWEKAWRGVRDIFGGIFQGLVELFKMPMNWIIDGINAFVRGINTIQIPDWVPGVGGMGFSIAEIPRLKVGMDYVPRDFYPAFLDEGERVLTKEQNEEYTKGGQNKTSIYNLYFNNVKEKDTAFEVYRAAKRGDRMAVVG